VDRSEWRWQSGGPPLFTSRAFLYWLKVLAEAVDVGSLVTTAATWPDWRERAVNGELAGLHMALVDASSNVWHPADGMAYVRVARRRDDSGVDTSGRIEWDVITLVDDGDEWRVHSVGDMVSPESIGKSAYSW
jgi:hypothetical protein